MLVEEGQGNRDANEGCSNHTTQYFSTRQVKQPSRLTFEDVSTLAQTQIDCSEEPIVRIDNKGLSPHFGL